MPGRSDVLLSVVLQDYFKATMYFMFLFVSFHVRTVSVIICCFLVLFWMTWLFANNISLPGLVWEFYDLSSLLYLTLIFSAVGEYSFVRFG